MFLVDNFIHVFDFLYRTRLGTQFFFVIKFIILLELQLNCLLRVCGRPQLETDKASIMNAMLYYKHFETCIKSRLFPIGRVHGFLLGTSFTYITFFRHERKRSPSLPLLTVPFTLSCNCFIVRFSSILSCLLNYYLMRYIQVKFAVIFSAGAHEPR